MAMDLSPDKMIAVLISGIFFSSLGFVTMHS